MTSVSKGKGRRYVQTNQPEAELTAVPEEQNNARSTAPATEVRWRRTSVGKPDQSGPSARRSGFGKNVTIGCIRLLLQLVEASLSWLTRDWSFWLNGWGTGRDQRAELRYYRLVIL